MEAMRFLLLCILRVRGGALRALRGDQVLADGGERFLKKRIVNYAMKFLGNPYVWAVRALQRARTVRIYDVRHEELWNLPSALLRFPGEQWKADQVQPDEAGDLIFYGNSAEGSTMLPCTSAMDRSSMQRAEEAESRSLPGTTELRCASWM